MSLLLARTSGAAITGEVSALTRAPRLAAFDVVPAVETRTGIAHVSGRYNYPGSPGSQFAEGCDAIWDAGFRTLKVWCTSAYALTDYPRQTWTGTPTTIKTVLQLPEYK